MVSNNTLVLFPSPVGYTFDIGLTSKSQGACRAAFLTGDSDEESTSLLSEIVGRIQFLAAVGLGSCFLAACQPGLCS